MEMKGVDFDRSSKQIKLPTIQHRKIDSSRILSSTMPENNKMRPASLRKVQNLEKKLFDKLQSYDSVVKKSVRKASKKRTEGQSQGQSTLDGYEKMQKLMPGLYSKLVEAKKGIISDTIIPVNNQLATSQPKLKKLSSSSQENKQLEKRVSKKSIVQDNAIDMTQEQLEELYKEYSRKQQLKPETTKKQLQQMNQSLLFCEKQIAGLTQNMEALINEIGKECIMLADSEQ